MNETQIAIQHFLHGFSFLQQYSPGFQVVKEAYYPYFVRNGRYEFLVHADPAEKAVPRLSSIAAIHNICFFPKEKGALQTYKDLGYRQRFTEYLMQLDLDNLTEAPNQSFPIERATSADQLEEMNKAKSWGRKYEPKLLRHENVHTLFIRDGDGVIGGGNLLLLREFMVAYIEDVFTVKSYQGQGVATGLMLRMLQMASGQGMTMSTLVSFASAAKFYAHLKYTILSELRFLVASPLKGTPNLLEEIDN